MGRSSMAYSAWMKSPCPLCERSASSRLGGRSKGWFWVAEFDSTFAGVDEKDNISPDADGAARLQMARTIDERCAILRDRFKAIFF
jgi:hypothetical protein